LANPISTRGGSDLTDSALRLERLARVEAEKTSDVQRPYDRTRRREVPEQDDMITLAG
jgi:hypothetical protein